MAKQKSSHSKIPDRRPCKARYNLRNQAARNWVRRLKRTLREQPANADLPPALIRAEALASFPYKGKF